MEPVQDTKGRLTLLLQQLETAQICSHSIKNAIEYLPQTHALIQVYRLANLSNPHNVIGVDKTPIYETARRTSWKHNLLYLIAKIYGCAILISPRHEAISQTAFNSMMPRGRRANTISEYFFVGADDNIQICRRIYLWLSNSIDQDALDNMKGKGRVAISNYCLEAVRSLLEAFKQAQIEIAKNYNCLSLHNKEALNYVRWHYKVEAYSNEELEPSYLKGIR